MSDRDAPLAVMPDEAWEAQERALAGLASPPPQVFVKAGSGVSLPEYATRGASGADLQARLLNADRIPIRPRGWRPIPTGIAIQIPPGFEGQIRPRSGLALDEGLVAVFGTIDQDYRGEVVVVLENRSEEVRYIRDGARIAQLVIVPVVQVEFVLVTKLAPTPRGEGGFGSTGK